MPKPKRQSALEKLNQAQNNLNEARESWTKYAEHIAQYMAVTHDLDKDRYVALVDFIVNLPPATRVPSDLIKAMFDVKLYKQQVLLEELNNLPDIDRGGDAAQKLLDQVKGISVGIRMFTFD